MSYVPGSGALNSFTPQEPSIASRSMGSTGQTTVVNVTEGGIVHFIVVETVVTPGVSSTSTQLKFTIDGGTASYVTVIDGTVFEDWVLALPGTGDGSTNNDRRTLPISFTYKTSLKIEIDCSIAGAGTLQATVLRSKKV